ncbi:MAG: class C sortase [Lachnospiraceae bacterium]|nr:class C sortase [Lachnospiraceae bacterium]
MKKRSKVTGKQQDRSKRHPGLVCIFFLGFFILMYPFASNLLAKYNAVRKNVQYEKYVDGMSKEELEKQWKLAKEYNENLSGEPVHDPFIPGSGYALPDNYQEVLNVMGDGIMGRIEIPSIQVDLPIAHGTSDEVLKKCAGHIEQTALPIGGKGTHAIITSHTGLPSAKLFTDLRKMEKGDVFYIYILDKKIIYQVDNISVVLPEEISQLAVVKGKDYVTLVTCTPYGINDHRLLVRGSRIAAADDVKNELVTDYTGYLAGLLSCLAIPLMIYVVRLCKSKKRR